MKQITAKQMEAWLGSDSQLEEAIEVLTELVNGTYTIKNFEADVHNYNKE